MKLKLLTVKKKLRPEQLILLFLILSGITLSLLQFFYNRSFWLDEANLALNVVHKSPAELFGYLDYETVAPVLFLQIEKLGYLLIPASEYGLRLFPLLCFWIALYCFFRLAQQLFQHPLVLIFALSLFVFNTTLLYYSSELKQYMTDVMIAVGLIFLTLKNHQQEKKKFYIIGIAGLAGIFLSHISHIILFTIVLYFLFESFKNGWKQLRTIVGVTVLWLIAQLLYDYFFAYGHPLRETMISYWSHEGAFMPANPFSATFLTFLHLKANVIFTELLPFGGTGKVFLFTFYLAGFLWLVMKRQTGLLILTTIPLAAHLVCSAFRFYPFDLRLILYLGPCMMIVIAYGFQVFFKLLSAWFSLEKVWLLGILIPLILLIPLAIKGFPLQREEIKKSIGYIQERIHQGDRIYVYKCTASPFRYYSETGYLTTTVDVIYGQEDLSSRKQFLNELSELKGHSWLLFSHVNPRIEAQVVSQLDSLGYKKLDEFETAGSATYLFDFGK